MTRTAIETQALDELRRLPPAQAQEALDFILFLRARAQPRAAPPVRPLGLMRGQATCHIAEDFAVTDEDLLRL
jgi:hypothetical protein